jgi:uncharacterized protein YbaP (TraB family)
VLFGSVHLLPGGLDWRPAALDQALAKATDLWFELPIDSATEDEASRLTLLRGRAPPGDTLWDHLTPAQRQGVETAAAQVGVSAEALAQMRPWLADLTLSVAADTRTGAVSDAGVEAQIQSSAPLSARRHALETVGEQVGFLASGTMAEQLQSLDETVREITTDPDLYERSVREWLAGDLAGLQHDDLDEVRTQAPAAYRRLILERNERWARILALVARRRGVTVVVVGAGHLIGPQGVPALLRARGLRVDGP